MAGRAADWDQLLLQSQDLVRSEQAFPRVQRDILQVEQYSQKLRARGARGDATAESLDASRLLAHEGLNPRKLTQALQTFELRPTYEDVFQVETATVDEYLQQVHEMISVTAIQEAQQSAVAAFEDFMDACMDSEWQQEKRALFDSVAPYSAATALTPGPSPGGALSPYAARPLRGAAGAAASPAYRGTPAGLGAGAAAGLSPLAGGGSLALRGRAAKYADVVRAMNAAGEGGGYNAVAEFAAACSDEAAGERRTTMARVWQVLAAVLGGVGGLPAAARAQRGEALLAGARSYLEANCVAYMQKVVAAHRTQAALGGSPSRLGLVNAFLRVKERDRGALDFDAAGGVDTTWQRLYCCLRAGFHAEAVQLAKNTREVSTPRAGALDLPAQLQQWAEGGCRPLGGDAAAHLAAECERLLRDKSARQRHPFSAQRAMVYALLLGNNRAAEAVVKDCPSFFPTIEDFLWCKLCLVRSEGRATSTSLAGAGAGLAMDAFTLSDLQSYLAQYPAAHYSHGGREPLLYAVVLLLSLQFRAAVSFLAKEAATRDYRLDAVHLAICLHHYGCLEPAAGDAGRPGGGALDAGALVHRYAKEFLYTDPPLALEYYMLAAGALGGSVQVKGQLLRELLVESKAYGYLLGSGGAAGEGGALARFIPDAGERGRVLEAVAHECAASAQLEEAVELFMFAGRPRQALRILTQRLSDAVEGGLGGAGQGRADEVDTLVARGNAAVAAMGATQDPEDLREVEAFDLLKSVRDMLAAEARGDHTRALQKLGELPFVPTERFRLQLCASGVGSLHPAVADRLPAVLLAAAGALAASGKREQLSTVVAFASAVPNRISQGVYQRLNQMVAECL